MIFDAVIKMKNKQFNYTIDVTMTEPGIESPILELVDLLQNEAKRLNDRRYAIKALAINTKWHSLSFLRAEIKALDKKYAGLTALRLLDKSLIISKIETYLTTARAILDILAYCLKHSLHLEGYDQSFNNLLKRTGDLPDWLADFVQNSMQYDDSASMSKNGWLLNLVTDKIHGKSLRDFVMHIGTIDLQSVQQFDQGYLFAFKPREKDKYLYHIEDMVDNVHRGMCELYEIIIQNLKS